MYRLVPILAVAAFLLSACAASTSTYKTEIDNWRSKHETELRADDGWLTLAGLFWLKEGTNTIGRGEGYDIQLTENFKQDKFGEIDFHDGKAILKIQPHVDASVDGKPLTTVELRSDQPGPATKVTAGSQTFYLIKREDRFGIRLKDSNSAERRNFDGEHWFPADQSYRVTGTFEPFGEVQEVEIPNVLGGTFKMKSPGTVKFKLLGKDLTLQPVIEDEKTLFFIFKDATSNNETYGAGRFLYTDNPINGQVVLDFNKAENPPCAFTTFATCPVPPPQNHLAAEIKAGELKTH
jgi:uncharacterized protein (DUF1684 family)